MDPLLLKANKALEVVNSTILGKSEEVKEVLIAILAGGNILLDDIPGVGKTTLALAFSKVMNLSYKRVQFTPDVLPSDLTGFSMYKRDEERFDFQKGSLFCNMLLADEINRTSPKTQSALLEAMEEHNVTVDGNTYKLPEPFVVIATQNPYGEVGTQMLPETQMDRFMISTKLGYPDMNSEIIIAKTLGKQGRTDGILPVLTKEELLEIQNRIYNIFVNDVLYRYIVKLVRKTRENNMIERGASTRAVIALVKLSKTAAWLNNRNYIIPEDIIRQYKYVIQHRITLNSTAGINHLNKQDVIDDILDTTKAPAPGKSR